MYGVTSMYFSAVMVRLIKEPRPPLNTPERAVDLFCFLWNFNTCIIKQTHFNKANGMVFVDVCFFVNVG